MEHLKTLQPDENTYNGVLTAHLSFFPHGFHSYQLCLGGAVEHWLIPMAKFAGIRGYADSLNDASMVFVFDPSQFSFLLNSTVSAWVRLTDVPLQVPDNLPADLDLQHVLVRIRHVRISSTNHQLQLEAVCEFEDFNIDVANKNNSWVKTVKAYAVPLFTQSLTLMAHIPGQFELLPTIQKTSPIPASVTDSALRFGSLRVLLDASMAAHSNTMVDWFAHYKKPKHNLPPILFNDPVPFPITEFVPSHGTSSMTIRVDGTLYAVQVGRPYVTRLPENPPSYQQAVASSSGASFPVPPLVRSVATTQPSDMLATPPVSTAASAPASQNSPATSSSGGTSSQGPSPPAGASQSQSGQPPMAQSQQHLPATQASDHFTGNRIYKRTGHFPVPSKKIKFSSDSNMMDRLLPNIPDIIKEDLSAAWGHKSQKRMVSLHDRIVKILGRNPYEDPRPFDSIHILAQFRQDDLKPSTIANYMSAHNKWLELNGLTQQYSGIISLAQRGFRNRAHIPLLNAASGFSLPFSLSSLRLVATGLNRLRIHPSLAAAVWCAALFLFWGVLRTGELLPDHVGEFDFTTQLCLSDIQINEDNTVRIWIKSPKAIRKEVGYHGDIVELLPFEALTGLCPVKALENYLRFRFQISNNLDLPLILLHTGQALSADRFKITWQQALAAVNVPQDIIRRHSNHGYRASLPSLLQLADLPEDQVMILGRWQSPDAYTRYLKNTEARMQSKRKALQFCQTLVATFEQCMSLYFPIPLILDICSLSAYSI